MRSAFVRLIASAVSAPVVLAAVVFALNTTPSRAEPGVVGRLSLAVGTIHRISADGSRSPLKLGDALHERDRIVTGSDALAMIVFVDQARMALRPDTELWIRAYRIDPSGADTQLDLELLRGTVRQISGRATQVQPERYRLNTPIAAIGVRGTDFLVRAAGADVSTYVHEGAIVIQPPASECPFLARCPTWAFSSAGDAGTLLQVQTNGLVRRFYAGPEDVERIFGVKIASIRANSPTAAAGPASATQAASSAGSSPLSGPAGVAPAGGTNARAAAADPSPGGAAAAVSASVVVAGPAGLGHGSAGPIGAGSDIQAPAYSGLTSLSRPSAVFTALASANAISATGLSGPTAPAGSGAGHASTAGSGGAGAGTDTSTNPAVVAPITALAWVRAATASPAVSDFPLLQPVDTAQPNRQITVGEVGAYNLWRNVLDPSPFPTLVGRFSFGLAAADASFIPNTGLSTKAAVDSASRLDINFDAATFSTQLRLGGPGAPAATLSASGGISTAGLFSSRSADGQHSLAGALALDGREAGYFFNLTTADGRYQGVTLWSLPLGAAVPSVAALPAVAVYTGAPAISSGLTLMPLPTQLVWGRFSTPADIPVTLAVPFEQASAGRQVTVGEVGQYALWRTIGAGGLVTGLKGEFSFGLSTGQAFYTPAGGAATVATINQATLGANFDTATFKTRLLLGGGEVPLTTLEASGRITEEGLFTSRSADGSQVVAGAFTANAKEAGYLFKMATKGGQFQGITLWGRKP